MLTSVRIASVCGSCRSSGSKSKRSSGISARLTAASSRAAPITQRRRRSSRRSSGAARRKPTGAGSPRGRSTVNSAGSSEKVSAMPMIMPVPAISPSSEMPAYAVGRNAKKPIAVAELDREIGRQTDEEHGEGDRDHVERADRDGGEPGRQSKAGGHRRDDRADQLQRAQRQEQDRADRNDRQRRREQRAVAQGPEFLVVEHDRAG